MGISVAGPWRHRSQPDELQFMIRDEDGERRIRLKRGENDALYDFMEPRLKGEPPPESDDEYTAPALAPTSARRGPLLG